MVAADARTAVTFSLSPGRSHVGPVGRELLRQVDLSSDAPVAVVMDRGYEGDETRQIVLDLGFIPVVPRKRDRVKPWAYDKIMYRRRNEVERLFRRLKGFRHVFFASTSSSHFRGVHPLRAHNRGTAVVLTRPIDQNAKEMSGRSPSDRIAFIREKTERVHKELDDKRANSKASG
jgi:transposase